ncbi:sugar transporter SWEET1 isoform X8 [Piliocolobus tephrosceles]|uniref:sugar transporter SWEET1 isoform X8 n=1 Tax=Piliocolobus tephrosceles TaxID=591936 RepID=UPI000C2A6FB3|nr:sugar transporter SWEET1 isoform X8 [Piliocolobus tephrosceles]
MEEVWTRALGSHSEGRCASSGSASEGGWGFGAVSGGTARARGAGLQRRRSGLRSDLRHMRMTRSVDNVQFLPFLTTEVNNLGWLSYGALKADGILIVVNTVGAALQTLYILAYLHYCPRKRVVLLQTATLLGVLLLGYGYFWLLVPNPEARLQQLGLFCSVFTISMYLSPLADLAKVIQTKSTQCLSYPLTIATLLTSASWCLYGFRLRDPYIMQFL